MRILLTIIALTVLTTVPASACIVAIPDLTFEQWFPFCAAEIEQTCSGPVSQLVPNCRETMAKGMYATYVQSQYHPPCGQQNAGASMCINGYVATCNGTIWVTSGQICTR